MVVSRTAFHIFLFIDYSFILRTHSKMTKNHKSYKVITYVQRPDQGTPNKIIEKKIPSLKWKIVTHKNIQLISKS